MIKKALNGVASKTGSRITSIARSTRIHALSLIGKNPYSEGSYGSLQWKRKRNQPLNADEQEFQKAIEEAGCEMGKRLRMNPAARFQVTYLSYAGELMSNLPKPILNDLQASSVSEARTKIEALLPLASYQRERTANTLAAWAIFIGAVAIAVSVGTLAVAVWTLCSTNNIC